MIDFSNAKSIETPKGEIVKIERGTEILFQKQRYKREVAYLECTGTQYINTGFTPNQDSGAILDFQATSDLTTNQMFGGRYTSTSRAFSWEIIGGAWTFGYKKRIDTGITADDKRHTVQIDKNICALDGVTIWEATYSEFNCYRTIGIGRVRAATSTIYKGYLKIYSCKIYDNGVLVRDYIPVLDWNDVPCMYDKVTDELFYNQGTDEFLYGGDA